MKKRLERLLLAIVLLVTIPLSAQAITMGLTAYSFIYEGDPYSQVFADYETGTLTETQYYTEDEASALNTSRLGWLFDLPLDYISENPLPLTLSSIYGGTVYSLITNQDHASLVQSYNESNYLLLLPGFSGDMSLLTEVTTAVSYLGELAAQTMYLGTEPSGPAPVPEPSTILLLGVGLFGLALYRKKRSTA